MNKRGAYDVNYPRIRLVRFVYAGGGLFKHAVEKIFSAHLRGDQTCVKVLGVFLVSLAIFYCCMQIEHVRSSNNRSTTSRRGDRKPDRYTRRDPPMRRIGSSGAGW